MNTNKTLQKPAEDLFTLSVMTEQISRALRITAEDTIDRFREYDIEQNMGVLYLLADNLDRVTDTLEKLDEYRAHNRGYID